MRPAGRRGGPCRASASSAGSLAVIVDQVSQRAAVDLHPLALPLAFVDLVVQRLIAAGCDPDLDSAVDTVCLHGQHGVLRVRGRGNRLDLLPRIPRADPGILRVRGLPARRVVLPHLVLVELRGRLRVSQGQLLDRTIRIQQLRGRAPSEAGHQQEGDRRAGADHQQQSKLSTHAVITLTPVVALGVVSKAARSSGNARSTCTRPTRPSRSRMRHSPGRKRLTWAINSGVASTSSRASAARSSASSSERKASLTDRQLVTRSSIRSRAFCETSRMAVFLLRPIRAIRSTRRWPSAEFVIAHASSTTISFGWSVRPDISWLASAVTARIRPTASRSGIEYSSARVPAVGRLMLANWITVSASSSRSLVAPAPKHILAIGIREVARRAPAASLATSLAEFSSRASIPRRLGLGSVFCASATAAVTRCPSTSRASRVGRN